MYSRKHHDEVQFYALVILIRAVDDLRPLPLNLRKNDAAQNAAAAR